MSSNRYLANNKKGIFIAAMGIPSVGKSSVIKELGKLLGCVTFLEPEETYWGLSITERNNNLKEPSNFFTGNMFFRSMRVPYYFKAKKLFDEGKMVLMDSYYDKLTHKYIHDKENFKWIFNYDNKYFDALRIIAREDYYTLPDANYIIYINTTEDVWKKFLNRRGRNLDKNEEFLASFNGQKSMKNAVHEYISDQKSKNNKVVLISVDQRFDSANTIAYEIYNKLMTEHFEIKQYVLKSKFYNNGIQNIQAQPIQMIIQYVKESELFNKHIIPISLANSEEFEITSLYYHAKFKKSHTELDSYILDYIESNYDNKWIRWEVSLKQNTLSSDFPNCVTLLKKLTKGNVVLESEWSSVFNNISTVDKSFLSLLLCYIYYYDISDASIKNLTYALLHSGKTYDYRNSKRLNNYKIIRRYPTGALSEKIALLMPALISYYSDKFKIKSPFLIAKSLGFTGGTWDKLNEFEMFRPIKHGNLLVKALNKVGAVYCMTEDDIAPSDKFLYQFRSLTGTVECKALIVSSIASKQLAIPADILVMDIRYGDGAFIRNKESAKEIGTLISNILEESSIKCINIYTDTQFPNGSCIGNFFELSEAINILKNKHSKYLNPSLVLYQKKLVIDMFYLIISEIDNTIDKRDFEDEVMKLFDQGEFFKYFSDILSMHGVSESNIDSVLDNLPNSSILIRSKKCGTLVKIDQKKLGNYINFNLNNVNYDLMDRTASTRIGVVLSKNIGDRVDENDILCTIYSDNKIVESDIIDFFSIE